MKRRMLAILLTLCMILGMIPAVAFADGKEPVAKANNQSFTSLQEAINTGGTVTLLKGVELTDSITVNEDTNVVLDLNGFTITGTPAEVAQMLKNFMENVK